MKNKILFTGGSGLLGSEMKKIAPEFAYPSRSEFDITDPAGMEKYLRSGDFRTIIHAAAFASPVGSESDPVTAIESNIIGTANVVKLCFKHDLRLIYISTDYVFEGTKGSYKETDAVLPVNKYAWSKLGGEASVRLLDNSLIIRTSFGPKEFPYEKAFTDQWTSREPVDAIAAKILKAAVSSVTGALHIGGARKTVYQYATSLSSSAGKLIGKLLRKDVPFKAPKDTSLNTDRYEKLF